MATTETIRRDFPAPARRARRPARDRAVGRRAVYDQDADLTVRDVGRVANPDAAHMHRHVTADAVHMHRHVTADAVHVHHPVTADPVHVRHPAHAEAVRVRHPAYDAVARWLALTSLALVTFIVALIILT